MAFNFNIGEDIIPAAIMAATSGQIVNKAQEKIDTIFPDNNINLEYNPDTDTVSIVSGRLIQMATELVFINIAESEYAPLLYHPRIFFKPGFNGFDLHTIISQNYSRFGVKRKKPKSNYIQFQNPVLVGHWARVWLYSHYKAYTGPTLPAQYYMDPSSRYRFIYSTKASAYMDNLDGLVSFLSCIAAYYDEFESVLASLPENTQSIARKELCNFTLQIARFVQYSSNVCKCNIKDSHIKPLCMLPHIYCREFLKRIIERNSKMKKEFMYNKAKGTFIIPEHYYKPDVMVHEIEDNPLSKFNKEYLWPTSTMYKI